MYYGKLIKDLKKVSEEVKSNEPETVQYQITQSDEDENEILIWEEVCPLYFKDNGADGKYKSKEGHERKSILSTIILS